MATSTSQAFRQDETPRTGESTGSPDLIGASNPMGSEAEARCVLCMAQHLLAAANTPGTDAAREAARRLETECPTCLSRPGGGR